MVPPDSMPDTSDHMGPAPTDSTLEAQENDNDPEVVSSLKGASLEEAWEELKLLAAAMDDLFEKMTPGMYQ